MSNPLQIVVCGGIVPDPLQTLEPQAGTGLPALKNELMLPAVLDPWASHALYEAANLAKKVPGSKVYLVSLGPKAKLQQVMMTVAQKVPFELVAIDGPTAGFADSSEVASLLAAAIQAIPGLDKSRLLLFGGWESASRGAGATLQIVGERLGITDSFRASTRSPSTPTDRLKCWSAWKAASTRFPYAPERPPSWAGQPATSASHATIRRSAWLTCAPSCPRCNVQNRQSWRTKVSHMPKSSCQSSSALRAL